MPLYLRTKRVVPSADIHFWESRSKIRISTVHAAVLAELGISDGQLKRSQKPVGATTSPQLDDASAIESVIRTWSLGQAVKRFPDENTLSIEIAREVGLGRRKNAFYWDRSENQNIGRVIHQQVVPKTSIGLSEQEFFSKLGNPCNPVGSHARNAEQEYLLQNMVKGALFEAARIADRHKVGISVRGTGVLAHMGIESGDPTKAQEFKNKTSKEWDLWMCDEMTFGDVGAVVHYDPRVGWKSPGGEAWMSKGPGDTDIDEWVDAQTDGEAWKSKARHLETTRRNSLSGDIKAGRTRAVTDEDDWKGAKKWFKKRLKEYWEEDVHYRRGHFKKHVLLEGPFIHLPERPGVHMYGDHDLFGFTQHAFGRLTLDSSPLLKTVQIDLQDANTFQAQHGGIWNWVPELAFHKDIKALIMGGHSAPKGEPLVYILPDFVVVAAFYVPDKVGDYLVPVWACPQATDWLKTTYSGKKLLEQFR